MQNDIFVCPTSILTGINLDNKKLNLAICGIGRFASRRIIPALVKCKNIELSAIVNRSSKQGASYSSVHRYYDLNDLIAEKAADAVYIASPNIFHAEQAILCLKSGLHVLCEKPMATNYKDCQSMLSIAKKMNLNLGVGHMLRFSPALKIARMWLNEGSLGELLKFSLIFHYKLPERNRSWVNDKKLSGGGVLLDAGTHCIDVIRFFLGNNIITSSAKIDKNYFHGGVESEAILKFKCDNVRGSIDLNSRSEYKTFLEISGSEGIISIESFAATWESVTVTLYNHNKSRVLKEAVVDVSEIYVSQLNEFVNNVKNTAINTLDYSAAENVKIIEEFYSLAIIQ